MSDIPSDGFSLPDARCCALRRRSLDPTATADRLRAAEMETADRPAALRSIKRRSSCSVQSLFFLHAIESAMLVDRHWFLPLYITVAEEKATAPAGGGLRPSFRTRT